MPARSGLLNLTAWPAPLRAAGFFRGQERGLKKGVKSFVDCSFGRRIQLPLMVNKRPRIFGLFCRSRLITLRSRLLTEPRIRREYGTIPVDPSDDAGDQGGVSSRCEP